MPDEMLSQYHPLAMLDGLRENELRLRQDGFFDSADMYRQLCDGIEREGGLPNECSWVDHGRMHWMAPFFGIDPGQVPRV